MGRISKALDKLRTKCTEAGTHPAGKSVADILECVAEHFDCTGEKGDTGAHVTAIALTTTEGAVTGGTATLSDGTTVNITVTEATE